MREQGDRAPASPSIWKPVGDGAWVGSRASTRYPVYTRGNAGEVYPEVFTPLSFSVAAESGDRGFRNAVLRTGLVRPRDLDEAGDVGVGNGVFGGYAYLNLSFARLVALRLFGARLDDVDVQFMGAGDPPAHRPDKRDRWVLGTVRGLRYQWRTLRATDPPPELERDQRRVAEFLAGLPDPATASDSELRGDIDELMPMFADLFEQHLVVSGQAGLAVGTLANLCAQWLDDQSLAVTLLAGLGDIESAEPAQAMWSLSRMDPASPEFDSAFAAFLAQHGCRGPNEWDTAFDTWETEPALARALIDRMREADDSHEPARQTARLARQRIEAEGEALGHLSAMRQRIFRRVLRSARMFSRARERSKTTVVRAIHGSRLAAKELDRRLVERSGGQPGDLWFMTADELDAYVADPAAFADTIAGRRRMHAELRRRIPPFYFDGEQPPLDTWELRDAPVEPAGVGTVLSGLPACPGTATGPARVITDPADPRALNPGDVLVAPLTDPSWTPLFVPASAVIVDVGAVMSHAAIVSRELGIPCVVSVTDATRRLADGAVVTVDGSAGTVTVVESA
jgi:pyruvate,water dikinase